MKNSNGTISNSIIYAIIVILKYTAVTILSITAIPYVIVKGICNSDYYEDWFDSINNMVKLTNI